jgi:hypothetical protein
MHFNNWKSENKKKNISFYITSFNMILSSFFTAWWKRDRVLSSDQGSRVKYKYFRKSFSLEALESFIIQTEQGVVDGGCDLKMNCSAWNN